MTADEMDDALRRLGLELDTEIGQKTRDRILLKYGEHLKNSKRDKCSKCWLKNVKKIQNCPSSCEFYGFDDGKPLEFAKRYLNRRNDIDLFQFVIRFVLPIYEEDTGNKDMMKLLYDDLRKKLKQLKKLENEY